MIYSININNTPGKVPQIFITYYNMYLYFYLCQSFYTICVSFPQHNLNNKLSYIILKLMCFINLYRNNNIEKQFYQAT